MTAFVSMILTLLATLAPYFQVAWTTPAKRAVVIRAVGAESEVEECVEAGREARVRFEMRLCRRRKNWFDACAKERTEHHQLSYDAITES